LGRAGANSRGRRGAFTLVEILTVVVILGICAAIIIPSVSNRDDLRVAAAARLVMADLIFAQNKAIADQKPYYVRVDLDNKRYSIHATAPTTTTTITDAIDHPLLPPTFNGKYVTAFGVARSQTETISLGTANFGGTSCLKFDELGVPYAYDAASAVSTQLTGLTVGTIGLTCGKFNLTVRVEPYTGELTVQ